MPLRCLAAQALERRGPQPAPFLFHAPALRDTNDAVLAKRP